MDKVRRHREVIEDLLREYSSHKPSYGEIDVETIIDPVKGHYQLVNVGWHCQKIKSSRLRPAHRRQGRQNIDSI
jgi:hypothetical protein